jgi:hypothetical protein
MTALIMKDNQKDLYRNYVWNWTKLENWAAWHDVDIDEAIIYWSEHLEEAIKQKHLVKIAEPLPEAEIEPWPWHVYWP